MLNRMDAQDAMMYGRQFVREWQQRFGERWYAGEMDACAGAVYRKLEANPDMKSAMRQMAPRAVRTLERRYKDGGNQ